MRGDAGALRAPAGAPACIPTYMLHPDSDLDVPHMNLDLLDETYPMVKSKLYFVDIDRNGLTGGTHKSDQSDQTCQFWVRTLSFTMCC
jgi:hypothetical protein